MYAMDLTCAFTNHTPKITFTAEELNEIHLNIESESFIVQLITELGRAFLAATDASAQTCASYALQVRPDIGNNMETFARWHFIFRCYIKASTTVHNDNDESPV